MVLMLGGSCVLFYFTALVGFVLCMKSASQIKSDSLNMLEDIIQYSQAPDKMYNKIELQKRKVNGKLTDERNNSNKKQYKKFFLLTSKPLWNIYWKQPSSIFLQPHLFFIK